MSQTNMLEEVFSQAMQMPDAEARRQYVQQACDGNPQLAEQVFALLSAAQEAGSFLEPPVPGRYPAKEPAQPTRHWGSASSKAEFPFLTAPSVPGDLGSLGTYRILNRVGRGGMGIVFRAFDPKLQRVVAVKVLAPEIAIEPLARKRFEREARSAAAVSHPHVVVIHAVDETHNPPYLVMEFVQGKTLAEKLASQGALSVKEILRIGAQMAEGLAAAHAQGLVHRDIKPANILLENGVERVRVTDFGLAKAVHDVAMTRTGDLSGTPQFMSPEQCSGGSVDHRTDLFSLGSVLYAMCTGRPPFRADSPLALLKRVCEDVPRPIQQVNPDAPDWLCAIIDRLLAKSPTDRIQTAAEVAALLQKHLATVQAGSNFAQSELVTKSQSTRNWRRLRRWPMLALSLLTGIGILAWLVPQQTQHDLGRKGRGELPPPAVTTVERPALGSETPVPFDGAYAGDRRVLKDMEMAFHWCPPGRFLMGSPKSEVGNSSYERQVEVTMPRGFWMQETEVTQSEWAKLMGSLPSHQMNKGKGDQYPIYYVSLNEAEEFCQKLTERERIAARLPAEWECRLPTEAEWEYACRAGTTTATAFGDQIGSSHANFNGEWPHNGAPRGPNPQQAVKVRSYSPNPWGIFDMHGNVKEFTATSGRVRGGSWCDSGRNCCSAIFIPDPPNASESVGFRVVLSSAHENPSNFNQRKF